MCVRVSHFPSRKESIISPEKTAERATPLIRESRDLLLEKKKKRKKPISKEL